MKQNHMRFYSASAAADEPERALDVLIAQLHDQVGADGVDLLVIFISAQFTYAARAISERLRFVFQPRLVIGCTAEAVIGRDREMEGEAAVSLVAAHLPGIALSPFLIQPIGDDWHRVLLDEDEFRRLVEPPDDVRLFLLLGDPFSTPMDDVLRAFHTVYRDIPVVGGMASGALRAHGNTLLLNDEIVHEGMVGVAFGGDLNVDVVVSQGCRPIWRPFRVQSSHRNVIFSLEGRPPLAWIQDLIPELPAEDRKLLQNGLFVGRSVKPDQEVLGRGDFLIRGVVGIDQENGALAIGDSVLEGEMIQFHLRDAETAQEDLEMLLIPQAFRPPPCGGLLFTCNGRGLRLYDYPNGDISVIQQSLDNTHLAGIFAAGEIGPIGKESFLHGHTASLVLFRPAAVPE